MSSSVWQVWAVELSLVLVLCCAIIVQRKRSEGRKPLPPGPTPWPVVGNMFQLSPVLYKSFADLSKKYGPLVFVKLGSVNILVACSADMAKAILQVQDSDFCSRPQKMAAGNIMTCNYSGFIMREHGVRWRQLKKILVTELLSTKRLATFQSGRTEHMHSMIRLITEESEQRKAFQLRENLYQCFSNMMTTMLANKAYFGPESNAQERREIFEDIALSLKVFGAFNPGDYFPFMKPFDLLGVERQARMVRDRLFNFFTKIIDEHRAKRHERGDSYVEDFVDILLSSPGFEGEKSLSDRTIVSIIQDTLIAGTDSSSNTTEFAIAELLRHPEIMRKAQEELDSVVGRDRLVTEEDIPSLKYMNAIIRENFRYHPVGPTGVPRVSPKGGSQLAGYYIPEGTIVMVNSWAIGRDPASWERPDEFDPGRFLGSNPRDVKGQDFELLPFGAGRRMCTGFNLALIVTQLALAQLLHCFDWSLPDGQTPESISLETTAGFTAGLQHPLKVLASPRLPAAVYTAL